MLSAVLNTIKTKKLIVSKYWVKIQQYTAVDFQGWSKIPLKIKMARISILEMGFKNFLTVICRIT